MDLNGVADPFKHNRFKFSRCSTLTFGSETGTIILVRMCVGNDDTHKRPHSHTPTRKV
jgi:hypothetical protein